MSRRVTRALLAATALCALTLTACSAPTDSVPVAGGELTVALDRELPTLDVANGLLGQTPILALSNALYQPLMIPAAGGTFAPGMAQSLTHDDTAKQWTLTLPSGITFADGSALTTESVRAHIARLSDPSVASSAAGQARQIASMTIVDETTMVFELATPSADFAALLARNLGMITSTTATNPFGFPLGAGPYIVKDFIAGDSVTLVRNEKYWGTPATLDTITFKMMPDADSRFQSLQSGDVDLMWSESSSQFQQARRDDTLAVHAIPTSVNSLALNLASPKFQDPKVRTALAQAIDRDAINAVVNLGAGMVVDSPYSLLGDGAPEVKYPEYDPDASRAVLGNAGLSFTLTAANTPEAIQRATTLKDMFGKVGVQTEIAPIEGASYASTLNSRDFEAADFVTSLFADPSGGRVVFSSNAPYNFTGYSNPLVDTALTAAGGMSDSPERAKHFAEASTQLAADLPVLWLTASSAGFIGSSKLAGIPDLTGRTLLELEPSKIGWSAE